MIDLCQGEGRSKRSKRSLPIHVGGPFQFVPAEKAGQVQITIAIHIDRLQRW